MEWLVTDSGALIPLNPVEEMISMHADVRARIARARELVRQSRALADRIRMHMAARREWHEAGYSVGRHSSVS